MSRMLVSLLLVLSLCLMGSTTCRFSTGTKKKGDGDRSGTSLIVDTRTSSGGKGASFGIEPSGVILSALGASVVPLAALAPGGDSGAGKGGAKGGAKGAGKGVGSDGGFGAGSGSGLEPGDFVEVASLSVPVGTAVGSTIPEPAAALLLAAGVTLVAWQLRRRRRARA
jgi:hypothetical protein